MTNSNFDPVNRPGSAGHDTFDLKKDVNEVDGKTGGTNFLDTQQSELNVAYVGGAGSTPFATGLFLPELDDNQMFSLHMRIMGADGDGCTDFGFTEFQFAWGVSEIGAHPLDGNPNDSLANFQVDADGGELFNLFPLDDLFTDADGQLILILDNDATPYEARIRMSLSPVKQFSFPPLGTP